MQRQTLLVIDTDDFFRILSQRGIRKKQTRIDKLAMLLQPSEAITEVVSLHKLEKTLQFMQANEEFMEALKQDIAAEKAQKEINLELN